MSEITDLRRWLPEFPRGIVFDVGANIGQTARAMIEEGVAPDNIWSFEPVKSTYNILCDKEPKIHKYRLALGVEDQQGWITSLTGKQSVNNHLTSRHQNAEQIEIMRGDHFCVQKGIDNISYLKIDTEGHDLDVISGFSEMINKIDSVLLEVSMNLGNNKHVPLTEAIDVMESLGFSIFKLYEQVHEFDGRPVLRRANVLFLANDIQERYE